MRRFSTKAAKYAPSPSAFVAPSKLKRDVIVIGGGHNGLVCASYLAKQGKDVLVLERREMIGGAAVTEEIVPGFKFSRGSYLAGLFRPVIIEELELQKYGFEYLTRSPSSFTPTLPSDPIYQGKSLFLGATTQEDQASIAQFSKADAESYVRYDDFLHRVRELITPLLDAPPPHFVNGSTDERIALLKAAKVALRERASLVSMYELFTGPATQILDRWFDSDILKTTLATDAVIGSTLPPSCVGSGYVLLHHVMGEAAGRKGVWAYVRGGMGAISRSIAQAAQSYGAEIATNATVRRILVNSSGAASGVEMTDGTVIHADAVVSNATPYHTFLELLPNGEGLPSDFVRQMQTMDYSCGAFKINIAVNKLPQFACMPARNGAAGPEHRGTIHFESRMTEIEQAAYEAMGGRPAQQPVIEMTIPSVYDSSLAPAGSHVVQLFIQFAPYKITDGSWDDPKYKAAFVQRVFDRVEKFAPGFQSSIIGVDALSPRDLERIFGLHEGNIMHGALSLQQLFYSRPAAGFSRHISPIPSLFLCGSGAHPGGGVMGAAGRNCAGVVLSS